MKHHNFELESNDGKHGGKSHAHHKHVADTLRTIAVAEHKHRPTY